MNTDLVQPREYDFRITRMRVGGRLAWVVEIRGLDISVHHWDSYDAAVRLAEIAVREHHQLEALRLTHFVASDALRA